VSVVEVGIVTEV